MFFWTEVGHDFFKPALVTTFQTGDYTFKSYDGDYGACEQNDTWLQTRGIDGHSVHDVEKFCKRDAQIVCAAFKLGAAVV
jgi:hypothetical protein